MHFVSYSPPIIYCILHQKCVMALSENNETYTAIITHYNHCRKLENKVIIIILFSGKKYIQK